MPETLEAVCVCRQKGGVTIHSFFFVLGWGRGGGGWTAIAALQ